MLRKHKIKNIYGTIYCLTNEKQYFGQTAEQDVEKYLEGHRKAAENGSERVIHRAIRKHGWDNFKKEIVCECGDALSLSLMEDFCINVFNTLAPNGYNLKRGGYHGKYSEQAKQNLSNVLKNNPNVIESQIKLWQNKKYRETQGKAMSKGAIEKFKNPKERENISKIVIERLKDPKEREKLSIANKDNPNVIEAAKKNWQNKKYRENHKNLIKNLPEIFCRYCGKKYKFPKCLETHEKICETRGK